MRIHRQCLLTLCGKQACALQLLLQLVVGLHQIAQALLLKYVGIQLIHTVAFVHCDAAYRHHRFAVDRFKAQPLRLRAEHYTFEQRAGILERKVAMTRRIALEVGHLADNLHVAQLRLVL